MWKKVLFKFMKGFLIYTLKYVFHYIDKDHDGKISKKEIKDLIKKIKKITGKKV
jgi:Ca2+-binding EF-hand superfamily protein